MTDLVLVEGSLRRVCQLTGERDRTAGVSVPSATASRSGLVGTDLGASVDLGERLVFLFGDTWPDEGLGDTLGWTAATEPATNLVLQFPVDEAGHWKRFSLLDPTFPGGRRPTGVFEVPTGGVANGNRLYVFYSQGHVDPKPVMGASVLARADDLGDLTRLRVLYEVSNLAAGGHFINVAPVVAPASRGTSRMVYLWGSGEYRADYMHLARVPLASIDDPSRVSWRYWGAGGWTTDEHLAIALFTDQPPGIGELSAAWIAPLRRWLVTYQLGDPRGVWFRTAKQPEGPYGPAHLLYHPDWPDIGYGRVMHRGWDARSGPEGTDLLYDRGRGEEWGGEYGPYLVSRFTRQLEPGQVRIAFALSSWNPYQAHLFVATLAAARRVRGSSHSTNGVPPPVPERGDDVGGVAFIRSTFGTPGGPGNYELLAPTGEGGLRFRARDNSKALLPWGGVAHIGLGPGQSADPVRYAAVSLLQSDLPDRSDVRPSLPNRLYVAARVGKRVVYLWREADPPWTWHGPFPIIAVEPDDRRVPMRGAAGNAVLARSHHGAQRRNWELMVPARRGGVHHFWRDNDPGFPLHGDWRVAPRFLTELPAVEAITLIESQLTPGVFALEVVARASDRMCFAWRDPSLVWHGPFPFVAEGVEVSGVAGVPSLIQSGYGARKRNFELVVPLVGGGIRHLWRDNDADDPARWVWHRGSVLDDGARYEATSLLQGPFGPPPGNLELMARAGDGRVMHFWRDIATMAWHGPHHVL